MVTLDPPGPQEMVALTIERLPVRLWWKLLETARQRRVSVDYLVFRLLAEGVGYNQGGESYDLVIKEIKEYFG